MITIGKPYVTNEGGKAFLRAAVSISDDTVSRYLEVSGKLKNTTWLTSVDYPPAYWKEDGTMWFSVPEEYGKYLCSERSDAFVIACLWYAMVTGSDVSFETPISLRLFKGITGKLLPALVGDMSRQISLCGPLSDELSWHENGVVAGMSCGVDSLYTLACYGGEGAPEGMRLTHLAYYDGNYLFTQNEPPYDLDDMYRKASMPHSRFAANARIIAKHHGLPFIIVQSNMDRDFYRGGRIYSTMYRFLACTLALEHLYGTYISSSSGHEDSVEVSLFVPTQHYEELLCDSCRTETIDYVMSDHESRSVKLRSLADDADVQKYLAVCFHAGKDGENCGECYGCSKTMIPLDIMGKLKNFGESFDLDKYYANRKKVFTDLLTFSQRPEASSARDSVRQFVKLAEEEKSEAGREFLEIYRYSAYMEAK